MQWTVVRLSLCKYSRLASVQVTTKRAASIFRPKKARRVERVAVDVFCVGCEGKGQARHHSRQPCHSSSAVTEVGVDVTNVGRVREFVGDCRRQKKLFQIDLARPRREPPPGANCLRECGGGGSRKPERVPRADAHEGRQETAQMSRDPPWEGNPGKRRGRRNIARLCLDAINYLLANIFIGRLYHDEPEAKPLLLHPVDFTRDESL